MWMNSSGNGMASNDRDRPKWRAQGSRQIHQQAPPSRLLRTLRLVLRNNHLVQVLGKRTREKGEIEMIFKNHFVHCHESSMAVYVWNQTFQSTEANLNSLSLGLFLERKKMSLILSEFWVNLINRKEQCSKGPSPCICISICIRGSLVSYTFTTFRAPTASTPPHLPSVTAPGQRTLQLRLYNES